MDSTKSQGLPCCGLSTTGGLGVRNLFQLKYAYNETPHAPPRGVRDGNPNEKRGGDPGLPPCSIPPRLKNGQQTDKVSPHYECTKEG